MAVATTIDYGRLRTDLLALAVLAMTVFLGLSLVSYDPADAPAQIVYPTHSHPTNLCGTAGAHLAHYLVVAVGAGAYVVLGSMVILDIRLFARDVYNDPVVRLCGAILVVISVCVVAQWYLPVPLSGSMTGNGGYVGAWAAIMLDQHFSRVGSLIFLATATVSGVLLTGEQHLARTTFCFLLLPVTIWSRLAFGQRSANQPVTSTVTTSLSPQIPAGPPITHEPDISSNDPAPVPDLPVSYIRVNAPPTLVPTPYTPPTAYSEPENPPEIGYALATSVVPAAPVVQTALAPAAVVQAEPVTVPVPFVQSPPPPRTPTPPVPASLPPRTPQYARQIVVSDGGLAAETVAAIASLFATRVEEPEPEIPSPASAVVTPVATTTVPALAIMPAATATEAALSTQSADADEWWHELMPTQKGPHELGQHRVVDNPILNSSCDANQPAAPALPTRRQPTYSEPIIDAHEPAVPEGRTPIRVNPPSGMNAPGSGSRTIQSSASRAPYRLPDTSILDDAEAFPYDVLAAKAQIAAATLEKTFLEFGLNVKVVEIDTGPVITQFELELEKGLRLSKVTALADDLAIALRVSSVRVIAPIPGKNSVGVEVPNDVRVMVRLKELIDCCRADVELKAIPMFLGKDAGGKPLVVDMCKMPHLLIAGRTGTGKSVCLNTLIVSILMTRSPDQVKMLMIDPKMVELSPYSRIPHLMHPVITDMKKAEAVLGWAVDKMEERYQLLSAVGVRHIDSYNKMGRDKVLKKLGVAPNSEEAELVPETIPFIVIIADEMADMMMTSGKDVEGHIIRLAQKSRAVGIHLVLATQKPTVDVITGLIKSNLPARISFQVASRMDSRVVLDEMGADKRLGKGDMLYMAPETSGLQRAQGTYVSDEEVNKVIEFFADQEPQYDEELIQLKAAPSAGGKGGKGTPTEPRDDLYDEAVEVVIREGRGSVSLLQRALGIGYGRGARMIDWMSEDGIVGGYNGSQAREVVMTIDEWEEIKESREMAVSRK